MSNLERPKHFKKFVSIADWISFEQWYEDNDMGGGEFPTRWTILWDCWEAACQSREYVATESAKALQSIADQSITKWK